MKVTIESDEGKDFPYFQTTNRDKLAEAIFIEKMKSSVRRRLELRPDDVVEIIIHET